MNQITTTDLLAAYKLAIEKVTEHSGNYDNPERALASILVSNPKTIQGLIEYDPSGAWFQRAFRQTDVFENVPGIDSAVWILLQKADVFWETVASFQNDRITQ